MNANVWIPQNINYNEDLRIFKFGEYFASWKGDGFVTCIKLVATKDVFLNIILFLKQ